MTRIVTFCESGTTLVKSLKDLVMRKVRSLLKSASLLLLFLTQQILMNV
jgi:hypothetical protein